MVFLLLEHSSLRGLNQGLIQAALDIDILILGTLIWACLNLILRKIETTIKCVSSFLIKSITYCEHNKKKIINKCNVSSFGLLNDNIGSSLCCNLVGENANLGTFLTINV